MNPEMLDLDLEAVIVALCCFLLGKGETYFCLIRKWILSAR